MSFNDLKPLYKEFLLKLAATLSQDELYQRSASIMRRRRRPQRRRSTRKSCLLGRAIKRSVSRLRGGPTEFTSVIFPARKLNESFDSSSSCDARNNRTRVLASRLSRKRSSWRKTKSAVGQTTSEDSDTCQYNFSQDQNNFNVFSFRFCSYNIVYSSRPTSGTGRRHRSQQEQQRLRQLQRVQLRLGVVHVYFGRQVLLLAVAKGPC